MNLRARIPARLLAAVPAVWGAALVWAGGMADSVSALCNDRLAVERVYYNHRTGAKPAFEAVLPRSLAADLVRADLRKEAVLQAVFGVTISPGMLEAEVQRINTTTRAPEMLAELKAALGNQPARFARTVARPILVERELRGRFENDERLHHAQRQAADALRGQLLEARKTNAPVPTLVALLSRAHAGATREITWQLAPRLAEAAANPPALAQATTAQGGPYSLQATVQVTPASAAPPPAPEDHRLYFEDLSPQLQRVLRVQLQRPGDVSAVIESPEHFLLFLARAKTEAALTVESVEIPKRSYDQWLAEQPPAENGVRQ